MREYITEISEDQSRFLAGRMRDYKRSVQAKMAREQENKTSHAVEVTIYADMVKVHQDMQSSMVGGGLRGDCVGFSTDSRRRLIQRMAMWNTSEVFLSFLTLTYPKLYSEDWQVWKRDLEAIVKRLQRRYKTLVGCCWRVEFQKRGAPHFHLILASSEPVCICGGGTAHLVDSNHGGKRLTYWHKPFCTMAKFRAVVSLAWAEVVRVGYLSSGGDKDAYAPHFENNLKAGTGLDALTGGRRQMMAYVSKYLAKPDYKKDEKTGKWVCRIDLPEAWGRNWGFKSLNGELDFSPVETVELDYRQSVGFKRIVARWLKSRGKEKYGRSIAGRSSWSVLGLGADSESGRALYRMLGGVVKGLFASHISPRGSGGSSIPIRFIDRVAAGLVPGAKKRALVADMRVMTPLGLGRVSSVVDCQILKRVRVSVILDELNEGSKWAALDAWQVKPLEVAVQSALW